MKILAMVGVFLESRIGPSLTRGTNTQLILLLPGTLTTNDASLASIRAIIEMPSVIESRVVSVAVFMEVSTW